MYHCLAHIYTRAHPSHIFTRASIQVAGIFTWCLLPGWTNIISSVPTMQICRDICWRGRSHTVLFLGPRGAGKTFVCNQLSAALAGNNPATMDVVALLSASRHILQCVGNATTDRSPSASRFAHIQDVVVDVGVRNLLTRAPPPPPIRTVYTCVGSWDAYVHGVCVSASSCTCSWLCVCVCVFVPVCTHVSVCV